MKFANPKKNEIILSLIGKRYLARLTFNKIAQFEDYTGKSLIAWASNIDNSWSNIDQCAKLFQLATNASYLRCLIATIYNGGALFEALLEATFCGIPDSKGDSTSDDTDFIAQLMELALNPEALKWTPQTFWSSSINELFSAIREQTKPKFSLSDDEEARLDEMMRQSNGI